MINYVLYTIILILIPFFEVLSINLLGVSLLVILWDIFFSKNDSILGKIVFIILTLILDIGFHYFLGSHLLSIFLFQMTKDVLEKFLPSKGGIMGFFNRGISLFFYYLFLNFLISLKVSFSFDFASILRLVISTVLTYIILEVLNGSFTFNKGRVLK